MNFEGNLVWCYFGPLFLGKTRSKQSIAQQRSQQLLVMKFGIFEIEKRGGVFGGNIFCQNYRVPGNGYISNSKTFSSVSVTASVNVNHLKTSLRSITVTSPHSKWGSADFGQFSRLLAKELSGPNATPTWVAVQHRATLQSHFFPRFCSVFDFTGGVAAEVSHLSSFELYMIGCWDGYLMRDFDIMNKVKLVIGS